MGSQLSVSAEEETVETETTAVTESEEQTKPQEPQEPQEPLQEAKHKVLFLTEDEAKQPSKVSLEKADDPPPGLILPNGDINWNCPCLGGMAVGPCGLEFREAFSCFHYSKSEVKGSECLEQFAKLQMCMKDFPELYEEKNKDGGETESGDVSKKEEEESTKDPPPCTYSQPAKA